LKNEQCIDNENLNGIKEETIKEEVQDIAFGLENPETKSIFFFLNKNKTYHLNSK